MFFTFQEGLARGRGWEHHDDLSPKFGEEVVDFTVVVHELPSRCPPNYVAASGVLAGIVSWSLSLVRRFTGALWDHLSCAENISE